MQRGHLFLFWNRSIVKWCTLIGYLFLSACIFVRKFIAHSKLRAVFSLCHIALLNSRNKYWFFIFDPWQGYTSWWGCARPPNVLHSRRGTSCASNFRRTQYFRNTGNWWDPHWVSKSWSCLIKPNNGLYNTQNSQQTCESRGVRTTKGGISLYIELEKHKLDQIVARNY